MIDDQDAEQYPECAKMSAVRDRSQLIGQFLDWLQSTAGVQLCKYVSRSSSLGQTNSELMPIGLSIEQILAQYLEIDLEKVEEEKRAMLEHLRLVEVKKTAEKE